jgi:hypothetical protein
LLFQPALGLFENKVVKKKIFCHRIADSLLQKYNLKNQWLKKEILDYKQSVKNNRLLFRNLRDSGIITSKWFLLPNKAGPHS